MKPFHTKDNDFLSLILTHTCTCMLMIAFLDFHKLILFMRILQLTKKVGKVKIQKATINYLDFRPKDPDLNYDGKKMLVKLLNCEYMYL